MIAAILHNVRSTYNVGAIMRTLDAVGGVEIVCCGITPYPELENDTRSPVVRTSNTKAIAKTALGAEQTLRVSHEADSATAIDRLRDQGYAVYALEQTDDAEDIFTAEIDAERPRALLLGGEVDGLSQSLLELCDAVFEIPQYGTKESLNVSVAAGIAMYRLR
ncbi:MAG: TrmH family RNA methyltransferase [Actinobacteria bacterium]|nr:TrmH family RNA methyltransferase [Actinomycetota bacterium]